MSDLSKYCVHLLGEEGLGPVRGGFPHFKLCCIQSYDGSRGVYITQMFPFCMLYYWQLTYVFDFVCFKPSKSQTIMPKSRTCGYSTRVPDTSVVGYYTAPTHY